MCSQTSTKIVLLSLRLLHPNAPKSGASGVPVRLRSDLHPSRPKSGRLGTPGLRQCGFGLIFRLPRAYPSSRHAGTPERAWASLLPRLRRWNLAARRTS
jgi:hypothetical protein